jgi:hypothetical protein
VLPSGESASNAKLPFSVNLSRMRSVRESKTANIVGAPRPELSTTSFLPSCVSPSPPVVATVGAGIPQPPSSIAQPMTDPPATRMLSIAVQFPAGTAT